MDSRILYVVFGVAALPLLLSVFRRREYYAYKFKLILRMELAYATGIVIAVGLHRQQIEPILWGLLASLLVYMQRKPRSRYISAAVKRRRRAEYERRTGKKYNPRRQEYDHEVPHARGGGNSEDNIRLVERSKNRSKGSTSPWWDLLGR